MINGPDLTPENSVPHLIQEGIPVADSQKQDPQGVFLRLSETTFSRQFFPNAEAFRGSVKAELEPTRTSNAPAPCLGFAGLAAAADQWSSVLEKNYSGTGTYYEAYCLKGHEIGWTGLIDTTAQDWKADVIEKALAIQERTGQLPVLLGHSTGALAVIAAIAQYAKDNPGKQLCSGLVISSPAFELQNAIYETALKGAKFLHWLLPRSGIWKTAGATIDTAQPSKPLRDVNSNIQAEGLEIPAKGLLRLAALGHKLLFPKGRKNKPEALSQDPDDPIEIPSDYEPEQKDNAPAIKWVPILTYLQLQAIQWEARKAVTEITVPTLALISRTDYITKPDASLKYFRRIPALDKSSLVIDGYHSLMRDRAYVIEGLNSTPANAFNVALETWLNDRRHIFENANLDKPKSDSDEPSENTALPAAPPMNMLRLKLALKNQLS